MSMTRKDYELIARTFKKNLSECRAFLAKNPTDVRGNAMKSAFIVSANELAEALVSTNPRFDVTRFLEACGV